MIKVELTNTFTHIKQPKTFTDFQRFLAEKYVGKIKIDSLRAELDADIEYFVDYMAHNALINPYIKEDTKQFLKNIITLDL